MKTILATIVLVNSAIASPPPKDKPNPAEQLVGVWVLSEPAGKLPEGTEVTVEFTKEGSLVLRVRVGESINSVSRGTFKAENDRIHYSIESGSGVRKETLSILKLTTERLVVLDPERKREEFRRVIVGKKEK